TVPLPVAEVLFSIFLDSHSYCVLCFFCGTATIYLYTLSLHDALPIYIFICKNSFYLLVCLNFTEIVCGFFKLNYREFTRVSISRSEEHTSEVQSRENLVCRLLLEKKKKAATTIYRYGRMRALTLRTTE